MKDFPNWAFALTIAFAIAVMVFFTGGELDDDDDAASTARS